MSTSFVEYHRAGFWAHDDTLRVWLSALAASTDSPETLSPWLRTARERWLQYSRVGSPGRIACGLEEYASEEERNVVMQQIVERALLQVGNSDWIPERFADHPREHVMCLRLLFLLLLRGELTMYVNSDLAYLKFL